MVNELIPVELYGENNSGDGRRFEVANGIGISKGTILRLTDPRTASAISASGQMVAGIAKADKEAGDGSTSLSAWTNGIFEAKASMAIAIGAKVYPAGHENYVIAYDNMSTSGQHCLGYALESAADDETINIRVQL